MRLVWIGAAGAGGATVTGAAAAVIGASAAASVLSGLVVLALVIASGLLGALSERGRRKTITETASALASGGVVIRARAEETLVVVRPLTPHPAPTGTGPEPQYAGRPVPRVVRVALAGDGSER